MRFSSPSRLLAAAVVSVAGLVVASPVAHAQIMVKATRSIGGGGAGSQVTKRSVEKYAELLGFSGEQKEAALAIHEGYSAAISDARAKRRAAMEEMRRASEDTGDHSVFMERMPKVEREYTDASQNLEKSLFSDLKLLLTEDQGERWPRVERSRRREVELRKGSMSGESVDLTEVVAGLRLDEPATTALAAPLEEYEVDLDRQLQARSRIEDDGVAFEPGKPLDMEKLREQMDKAREEGMKIKEVNERHARKIEGLLPEDHRSAFRDAVKHQSFPRVYRPARVTRDIDAALKFDDLDATQRQTLNELRESYARDAASLNDAWASAIEDAEKEGQTAGMGGGGGRLVLSMGDEPQKLVDARKARRELDDKVREKINAALTEAQKSRLPKGDEPGEGGAEGHFEAVDAVMIRSGG
jgi:hypothetical protein